MAGKSQIGIHSVESVVQLNSEKTMITARLLDGWWSLNPVGGPAQLMSKSASDKNAGIYMWLNPGSLTTFSADANQPSGLDIQLLGFLHLEKNDWFINGEHIAGKIELDGETIRKERQTTWISGTLEPLPPDTSNIIAHLRVLEEKPAKGACLAFTAVAGLGGSIVGVAGGSAGVAGGVAGSVAAVAGSAGAAVASVATSIIAASSSLAPGTVQAIPSLP